MHTLQEVYGIATIGDFSSVIREKRKSRKVTWTSS